MTAGLGYGVRGFQPVYNRLNPHELTMINKYYKVATGRSNGREVVQGMILKVLADGTVDGIDAADSVNTTGTEGSTAILGVCAEIYDEYCRPKKIQRLAASGETGYVRVWAGGQHTVYRGLEDAVGGAMATTTTSVAVAVASAGNATSIETDIPHPECNDLLDSSTAYDNTNPAYNHLCYLVAPEGDPRNRDTTKVWLFRFNPDFLHAESI